MGVKETVLSPGTVHVFIMQNAVLQVKAGILKMHTLCVCLFACVLVCAMSTFRVLRRNIFAFKPMLHLSSNFKIYEIRDRECKLVPAVKGTLLH